MMKLKNTVILLLLILLTLAAAADAEEASMLSAVVLDVSYDGAVVVKMDRRAEVFLLYGIRFPDTQDDAWQDARRLCRKMVMNKSVTIEPMGHDRWGRKLGRIYVGDHCLNDELLDKGFAKPEADKERAV
jgi:endonuclease YncB( thermonuclease family)